MTNRRNDQTISANNIERRFSASLHFLIYQVDIFNRVDKLIAASYVAVPEIANSLTSIIAQGGVATVGYSQYQRTGQSYKRIERAIGLGDIEHSIIYNDSATKEGIDKTVKSNERSVAYIISMDGDIKGDLSRHIISRFGLPDVWKHKYYEMFKHLTTSLTIIKNENYAELYQDLKAVALDVSEDRIMSTLSDALQSGEITIPVSDVQGEFDPSWTLKEYMIKNSEVMGDKLAEMRPTHIPGENLDPAIATMARIPFPAQANMIQGVLNGLKREDSIFCSADMGTGKTIVSIAVAHVLSEQKKRNNSATGMSVLVSAPGIVLDKWKNAEILATLPNAKVDVIENFNDAIHIYQKYKQGYRVPKGEIHFTLVGIDKAKSSHPTHYAGLWKRVRGSLKEYAWHCPECYLPISVKKEGEIVNASWSDIATGDEPFYDDIVQGALDHTLNSNGIPENHVFKWKKSTRFLEANHKVLHKEEQYSCGCKMYRPALRSRKETTRRNSANISEMLAKLNGKFDLYIADEVHKSKGSNTGRGDAFGSMLKSANKSLLLTGTLVNGKSSSIKELLWKTDPKALIEKGFSDQTSDAEWANRYGKLENIIILDEDDPRYTDISNQKARQLKESAGIAPHMTSDFLLHKAGFMELGDIGLPLVKLKEIPIFVDMDPRHKANYVAFHKDLHKACSVESASGTRGAWSRFTPATIMYGDRPDIGANLTIGESTIKAEPIEGNHAKERKLIELVQSELGEGRNCVIYNTYTGAYKMNERILDILDTVGINAEILNEPNTERRSKAIERLEHRGVNVIITNMKNVEVGLDLLFWPTIINYQMTYEVAVFRQSNRRNWRIGQDKECRCYILAYNGTQQMSQFQSVMSGRGHAMLTEGRLDQSDLAAFSRDAQSDLAADLAGCFAETDLADAWTQMAARDLADIEIIEEEDFKDVIAERMIELSNETKRLCNYVEPVIIEHAPEQDLFDPWVLDTNVLFDTQDFGDLFKLDDETESLFDLEELNSFEVPEPKEAKRLQDFTPEEETSLVNSILDNVFAF